MAKCLNILKMLMSNSCPSLRHYPQTHLSEKMFPEFSSCITPSSNVIHFLIKVHSLKYVDLQKSQLYIRCKSRDIDGGVPDGKTTSSSRGIVLKVVMLTFWHFKIHFMNVSLFIIHSQFHYLLMQLINLMFL